MEKITGKINKLTAKEFSKLRPYQKFVFDCQVVGKTGVVQLDPKNPNRLIVVLDNKKRIPIEPLDADLVRGPFNDRIPYAAAVESLQADKKSPEKQPLVLSLVDHGDNSTGIQGNVYEISFGKDDLKTSCSTEEDYQELKNDLAKKLKAVFEEFNEFPLEAVWSDDPPDRDYPEGEDQ